MASGVAAGDRVGIMSRTRYEWSLVDFAIWFAGAVSVPIYETSSPSQVAWNLGDSGAVAAFGEVGPPRGHHPAGRDLRRTSHRVANVWQLEGGDSMPCAARRRRQRRRTGVPPSGGRPLGHRHHHLHLRHHGQAQRLRTDARQLRGTFRKRPCHFARPRSSTNRARTIMFLPLAHVFARFISVLAVAAGVHVAHTPDIKNLLPDLQSYQPTFILAVPRVFEKVYNSALTKAEDGGKGAIFHRAADTAIAYSKARQAGHWASDSSSSMPCSTNSSTASFAPPWAARLPTRSPAAALSGNAWATSSRASACRSSRATASPRPPPRSR